MFLEKYIRFECDECGKTAIVSINEDDSSAENISFCLFCGGESVYVHEEECTDDDE